MTNTTALALNNAGRVVAAPTIDSVDEALDLAYRWNADETREEMIVSTVVYGRRVYPVAVQLPLF